MNYFKNNIQKINQEILELKSLDGKLRKTYILIIYNKISFSEQYKNDKIACKNYCKSYSGMYFDELVGSKCKYIYNKVVKSKTFCDLGSGVGDKIMMTAIGFKNFCELYGVELSEGAHNCAVKCKEKIKMFDSIKSIYNKIHFINENIFDYCYKDIDVLFLMDPLCNDNLEKERKLLEKKLINEVVRGGNFLL